MTKDSSPSRRSPILSPGQIHLVPLRHSLSFAMASEDEAAALIMCLELLLAKNRCRTRPASLQPDPREAPKPWNVDPAVHWYLELIPRLTQFGGFELATGIPVNPLIPRSLRPRLSGPPLQRTTARLSGNRVKAIRHLSRAPALATLISADEG